MKAAGKPRSKALGRLISLVIIGAGIYLAVGAAQRSASAPSSDDATIDGDVVHVAAAVGGRIIDIPVAENDLVAKGDLLFQIDPEPYRLALAQAQSELDIAVATLASQRRALATQRSAATVAADQVKRAVANLELATRTVERLGPLAAKGYVPAQQLDQAQTSQRDAATSLVQAREQEAAAVGAIDTDAAAEATVRARQAAVALARRAIDDTTVRAVHAGRITGLSVSTGEMIAPSQTLFTLVNTEEWFAVANFRETDLSAILVGDCATVYSMIDRTQPIRGVVQGLGAGVLDTDRITLPRSVPYVERSLNWVRVAQRFPVRVRLDEPSGRLVRLGASAVVEVKHGRACK
jgi:membrane fusion protein, multidrug efflux system